MLAVLPICSTDLDQMDRLLSWCQKLGGCKGHTALIVTHTNIPFDRVIALRGHALEVFDAVELIGSEQPDTGWPDGSNALFWSAARHCAEPFLWLEADCAPMRAGWLNDISTGWDAIKATRLFMGHIYDCTQPFLPSKVMSGIAVYSPEGISKLPFLKHSPRAWDVDGAEVMVETGISTWLIHHFWGQPNLPPTFVARKDANSPVNAMTLDDIPRDAALYHRNKDGSLIRLLERKFFPHEFREKIAVCFPVYQGDIGLAILHANWMQKMGRRHEHRAIICHDPSCPVVMLNQFEQLLRATFAEVESFVYPRPGIPTYPACANWAFQNVALHMSKGTSPWFWCEADLVVLRSDWVEQLQAEYDQCARSWMGPVVAHMLHLQGTSVYPPDAAARMPRAMRAVDQAFDMVMKEETLHDRHDCGHLIHHVWTILNGQLCPVGGGQIPANATPELLNQIPKTCVATHRWKDRSVLDLLLSGQYKHQ